MRGIFSKHLVRTTFPRGIGVSALTVKSGKGNWHLQPAHPLLPAKGRQAGLLLPAPRFPAPDHTCGQRVAAPALACVCSGRSSSKPGAATHSKPWSGPGVLFGLQLTDQLRHYWGQALKILNIIALGRLKTVQMRLDLGKSLQLWKAFVFKRKGSRALTLTEYRLPTHLSKCSKAVTGSANSGGWQEATEPWP